MPRSTTKPGRQQTQLLLEPAGLCLLAAQVLEGCQSAHRRPQRRVGRQAGPRAWTRQLLSSLRLWPAVRCCSWPRRIGRGPVQGPTLPLHPRGHPWTGPAMGRARCCPWQPSCSATASRIGRPPSSSSSSSRRGLDALPVRRPPFKGLPGPPLPTCACATSCHRRVRCRWDFSCLTPESATASNLASALHACVQKGRLYLQPACFLDVRELL